MNVTKNFVIGIIAYMQYDYLDMLLNDINKQTIWPKEVIISDNGEGYKLKIKYNFRITIIKNSYNYGTCRGLNQIIKICNNQEHILFMCDDNFFIENTSLEKIYEKFIYENTIKDNHIYWVSHWASFMVSKKWISEYGLFDENLWPCYYEDSDSTEIIRKKPNTVLCKGIGVPILETSLEKSGSVTEVLGNRHATASQITNVKYADTVWRTCSYYMTKWKKFDTINNDEIVNIHENTKDFYVDSKDVDFYKCHVDFLKNTIKNYKIVNSLNNISEFIDDILNLNSFNFQKIIEYKTQRSYTSQILLHLKPIEFISYDDNFLFNSDFCYHLNYLMNYNITIKLLNTSEFKEDVCDLLVINFDCELNDIKNIINSKFILIFTKDKNYIVSDYQKIKEYYYGEKCMFLFKKDCV